MSVHLCVCLSGCLSICLSTSMYLSLYPFFFGVCVYTVITNGFSSCHRSCTIQKKAGASWYAEVPMSLPLPTKLGDMWYGYRSGTPDLRTCYSFNCWLSVLVYELCVVSSIVNLCPLKFYCQATQEIRRRLWHHSRFLLAITPQCVLGVWPNLVAPSVGFDQSKSHERAFSRIPSGVWISEAVGTSSACQASYDGVKILHWKIQSKQP